jgi:NAD-dependent deacetylase
MSTISLNATDRVLVLTGAGISAESGIPTFRDAGGLWEGNDVHDVASPDGFRRDPLLVWRFYSQRRAGLAGVVPNAAHLALAALEERLGDRLLLATQNVDGLHAAAGSKRIVEMHGNLMTSRCTSCDRPPFEDTQAYRAGVAPMCGLCRANGRDALLRPHIVWFGESLDPAGLGAIRRFIRTDPGSLVFVQIGTSAQVEPAASLVDDARHAGARTWLVNVERPANADRFDHVVLGKAGEIVPTLFA